jgi:hypothetical protein
MRIYSFIIILPLLCWGNEVRAQVPEESSSMPEQWQLTLDVIKSKTQNLVVENQGLQVEYRKLTEQVQELQQSIEAQQYKNDETERFLKERHGRKRPEAKPPQKIVQSRDDGQLAQLRKQLEDEKAQEVLLENNRLTHANAPSYDQLKSHKAQLEADINAYELNMDRLKQMSLTALSWPLKKKKLVHEMVLTDARNNKMREKIKALREDIDVLRDQVARLERRVDFAQGK